MDGKAEPAHRCRYRFAGLHLRGERTGHSALHREITEAVMSHKLKALVGIGVAALLSGRVTAQEGLVTQRNLSLAMAKTIAEATLAECKSKGFNTAVAVVDRAGQVLVLMRDEQATAQVAEMARRKAYTARMFRMTTADFQKRTMPDQ